MPDDHEQSASDFIEWCACQGFGHKGWPPGAHAELTGRIRAAFAAGAEAMREVCAEDVERWHADYAQDMAADIRALPLPTMEGI